MVCVSISSVALWGEYACYPIGDLFCTPAAQFGRREGTNGVSAIPKWRIRTHRVVQLVEESYVSQEQRKSVVVGSARGTKTLMIGLERGQERFNHGRTLAM